MGGSALPPEVQQAVHTVYGDATAHIFLLSAAVAVVGASTSAGHRFAGSVATKLIKTGHWPVLVVP